MCVYISSSRDVLSPGDHVAIRHFLYTHHVLYLGGGIGAHLTLKGIVKVDMDELIGKRSFWVIRHIDPYPPEEIVKRAKSRLYDGSKYNLVFNNCEQFCSWCCTGFKWSAQVFGAMGIGTILGPIGHILGQIANTRYPKYRLKR